MDVVAREWKEFEFLFVYLLWLCAGEMIRTWWTEQLELVKQYRRIFFFFSSEEVNFCSFRNANEHWTNRGRWWWRLNEEENEQNWCSENECEPMKGQNQNHEFKTFFFFFFVLFVVGWSFAVFIVFDVASFTALRRFLR